MSHLTTFTPIEGLAGGAVLGTSVYYFLTLTGRVLGVSGILSAAALPSTWGGSASAEDRVWRLAFVGGIVAASIFLNRSDALPLDGIANFASVVGAGFLVGLGTKMGSGCTSGHLLCGISRLSVRSFVATFFFFSTAIFFNLIRPSSMGAKSRQPVSEIANFSIQSLLFHGVLVISCIGSFNLVQFYWKNTTFSAKDKRDLTLSDSARRVRTAVSALTGFWFGIGLIVSGMTDPRKVLGFLDVTARSGPFDATLSMVVLTGLLPNVYLYNRRFTKTGNKKPSVDVNKDFGRPLLASSFYLPTAKQVDRKLVLGSILFGIGWGWAGICPGPGLVLVGTLQPATLLWVGSYIMGTMSYAVIPL